ncbi:SRPBCC family protein [Promicromonospora thailandica]|uniref:Polyketide cyclase / dehydrase and lipid transport n=1 Tax=Promicromonospora thailandica TaxID=765201 RepID=A0A9X2G7B1_9MICO|nr:SRPBCC family protein [Promicromonospora thailandica]MCP2267053.1 Polyketide cyclase / dehydrase and lipid transport [Promicromonospora thailandica]
MVTVARAARCTPEDVLGVLADGWLYSTWVVGAARIRAVDPAWPEPGTRILHSVGLWPVLINDETVVLERDPERSLTLQARGWPAGEARVRIEVDAAPSGCRIRISEDANKGPGALIPRPLRDAAIGPRNVETLRRLALLAERRSPEQLPG